MDYDLTRIDYTICGITYPDTLKVLPATTQKQEQKFVVGDKTGVLQCLSIKDEEPVVQFKTLPGKPITSVQLASSIGTQADKIFTASGNEVKGYTKKGKVFLTIETALSDTITSMCVHGSDLIISSGCTVTFYRDLREYQSYVCEERVLDIVAFATPNNTKVRLLVLIANKGAAILESGQLISRTTILSGPSRLAVPPLSHTADIYAFYGASDGSIGLIIYEGSVLSNMCLVDGGALGAIVCLGWYFNDAGVHLAVGRHDGSVQLYFIDMDNLKAKPRLKFTYFSGEPVTSVAGGCVGTDESELLVSTFSGRIFALRSSHLVSGAALAKLPHENLAVRRSKLEVEIARLEKQTANEREKYQRTTRSLHAGLSTPPLLDIQYELAGATRNGWQEVKITSAVPLDMLFLYCAIKLDLLTDSAAVLSICTSQDSASDLLATVRCQAGTRRIWVRMRYALDSTVASRSESKKVLVYTLPAGAPRVARLISFKLPALPYYSQHEDPEQDSKQTRCWCQLKVSGSFSVAEVTSWLSEALPGELPRPAANVCFARSHTLLGTFLICRYQRGLAVFRSDNITTIAIIRDIVSNCSVEKRIRVEISCDIPENCCAASFKELEDVFRVQYQKNKDMALKNAISSLELDASEMDVDIPILCEDYATVWRSPNDELLESYFTEIVETIMQWYTDWRALSLSGSTYKNESSRLRNVLEECQVEEVMKILSHETESPEEF